jgi:hypothetical protein
MQAGRPGEQVRLPRGGGTEPCGVGRNADAAQVEAIGVPAGLDGDMAIRGPVRVASTGRDEEGERWIREVEAVAPEVGRQCDGAQNNAIPKAVPHTGAAHEGANSA